MYFAVLERLNSSRHPPRLPSDNAGWGVLSRCALGPHQYTLGPLVFTTVTEQQRTTTLPPGLKREPAMWSAARASRQSHLRGTHLKQPRHSRVHLTQYSPHLAGTCRSIPAIGPILTAGRQATTRETATVALYVTVRCRCRWVSLEYVSLDLLRYGSIWDDIFGRTAGV